METFQNLVELWPKVKPLLLPYDGAASQAYTLDVPKTELARVIDVFCRRARSATITTLNGYTFTAGETLECNIVNRTDVLRSTDQSIIVGDYTGDKWIQFWIWPHQTDPTFDAEFVFFADEFFKDHTDDDALRNSFGLIYSLAEMARENHEACECVVSSLEVGNPRQEREAGWTVFW